MQKEQLYILPFEYLSDTQKKVIKVNNFILENPDVTIKKACELFDLSKSAYYKYNRIQELR